MAELKVTAYVSSSLIANELDLEELVAHARSRNLRQGVTGVLLFSGGHFAQWLEGAPSDVDQIINDIRSDGRHTGVLIFLDQRMSERRFQGWSLAYNGTATFVDKRLKELATTDITSSKFEVFSKSVVELFVEFVRP